MKKIIAICGSILLLTSCTKEELNKTYCAYCTELTTGSSNTSYCGNSSEVDAYIENMEVMIQHLRKYGVVIKKSNTSKIF